MKIAWSYSSLTAYETCPRRYYLTRVKKVVTEPQTAATIHGNEVHKALELHVGGSLPLPDKYEALRPLADKLRMAQGQRLTEYKFALNRALQKVEYFAKDVWVRGVLDLAIVRPKTALVLDYKTGKRKFEVDQLKLFAGASFRLFPHVQSVKTGYIWLGEQKLDTEEFTREQEHVIWQEFAARVHRMEQSAEQEHWPARPSGLCREWCPVGKRHCEHCGKN
jgi:hypothetical protein